MPQTEIEKDLSAKDVKASKTARIIRKAFEEIDKAK